MTNHERAVRLRQIIQKHFSNTELVTLCFDLEGVDYDRLSGTSLDEKTMSLLQDLNNRNRLEEAENWIEQHRKDIDLNFQPSTKLQPHTDTVAQPTNATAEDKQNRPLGKKSEPYIIDRLTVLDLFDKMISKQAGYRILRIVGGAKMGKSHLLKEFYRRSLAEFQTLCAMVEVGEKLADPQAVLFALKTQLPALSFANYDQMLDENPRQFVETKDAKNLFSELSNKLTENQKNEIDRQRKLTNAFIDDIKINQSQSVLLCFDTIDHAPDLHGWFLNEFLNGLCHLDHLSIVVAGRKLPENPINLEVRCQDHDLEPFEIDHYREVKERLDLDLDDEKIEFLYKLFDGKPGPMFEVAPKFRRSLA